MRDKITQKFKNLLLVNGYDAEQINELSSYFTIAIHDCELTERTTEVGFLDDSNEMLLKMYASTLLTEGKSRKTVKVYIDLIKKFGDEVNKGYRDVTTEDIRYWLAIRQQTVTLHTCEVYRSYLSAFYQWLLKEEYIQKNPMIKIKPIKYEKKIKKAFTEVEMDSIRNSCKTLRERAEIELLASSGIRVSECASLNKSDIDFRSLSVTVRNGKGNKQRITYMNDLCASHLIKYLESRTDDAECLFYSQMNNRLSVKMIQRDLKQIGQRAGVENVHPHRLRRHFATSLSKHGMDIRPIQTLMGHADINVTTQYIATDSDYVKTEYKKYI